MISKPTDHEYISRQFFAVLRAIANGATNLLTWVSVPDDLGRKVRIDKALEAAASYLEAPVPNDCLDIVEKACHTAGIKPPSNKMNEIARAIFDALRAAQK